MTSTFYGNDARTKALEAVEALYNAVSVTQGPLGGNVMVDAPLTNSINMTHDGVTVARAFDFPNTEEYAFKRRVIRFVRDAADRLNIEAGDGTTTVTTLTYPMLKSLHQLIENGENPQLLKRHMKAASLFLVEEIAKLSEDITGDKDKIRQIAIISAGDEEIGNVVADVIEQVGEDGVVTVETGKDTIEHEIVEGFTFHAGWTNPSFVTDSARQEVTYTDPAVIVIDRQITMGSEIVPIIECLMATGKKDVIFIADDIAGEALQGLIVNKQNGNLNSVSVHIPYTGADRQAFMEDVAKVTGSTVVSDANGLTYSSLIESIKAGQPRTDFIGVADKVTVGKDSTTLIGGKGIKEDVDARIEALRTELETAPDNYTKQILQDRLASLHGIVGVIKVGGQSNAEINEKLYRVDDAVSADKAALSEGIVAGGGVTLANLIKVVENSDLHETAKTVLRDSLGNPQARILKNAGATAQYLPDGMGINVLGDLATPVDMKAAGVIDPARVTRLAVETSISIATQLATLEAAIVPWEEPRA